MQPGIYQIVPAPEALRPFVRRFMHANVQEEVDVLVKPAPTGFNYLGHRTDGELTATVDGVAQPSDTPFHFSGQIQHQDISVRYRGTFEHLLAEFTPTGLYRLLNVRGASVHAMTIDVATIDPALSGKFEQALAGPEPQSDQVQALADLLVSLIPSASGPTEIVDPAATIIEAQKGRVQIGDICTELGVSERLLNRQFREIVGIPIETDRHPVDSSTAATETLRNFSSNSSLRLECTRTRKIRWIIARALSN